MLDKYRDGRLLSQLHRSYFLLRIHEILFTYHLSNTCLTSVSQLRWDTTGRIYQCDSLVVIDTLRNQNFPFGERSFSNPHAPMAAGVSAVYHNTHYTDVIMGAIASLITSLTIVYSSVHSGADQRKHQSSSSLAFVRGIHRDRCIPHTNGQ